MKCYFCEEEARAVCQECGAASCKKHGQMIEHHRHVVVGHTFMCNDCFRSYFKPTVETLEPAQKAKPSAIEITP